MYISLHHPLEKSSPKRKQSIDSTTNYPYEKKLTRSEKSIRDHEEKLLTIFELKPKMRF